MRSISNYARVLGAGNACFIRTVGRFRILKPSLVLAVAVSVLYGKKFFHKTKKLLKNTDNTVIIEGE